MRKRGCKPFTLSQPDLDAIQNLDGYLFTMLRHLHLANVRRGLDAGRGSCLLEARVIDGDPALSLIG